MPPMQVVMSLIGIVVVIAGAYYATYYIGLKASGKSRGRNKGGNRNITLRGRYSISKDKSFCLVEIAGKIYVVGVTNQSMTLLDTLDAAEYAKNETEDAGAPTWNAVPGGAPGGKLVNRLTTYMAQRMAKKLNTRETDGNAGAGGGTFADNMKSARQRDTPGQQEREKSDNPDKSSSREGD